MLSTKRLRVEVVRLERDPVPLAIARPLESNILEWRFLIQGIGVYEGGYYQGKLTFPPEYPSKPPGIMFLTPSGRFATHTRICLSISDFHPETWTPSWTVGTILTGIVSFFNGSDSTVGSVHTSDNEKMKLAAASHSYNLRDKQLINMFGENYRTLFMKLQDDSTPDHIENFVSNAKLFTDNADVNSMKESDGKKISGNINYEADSDTKSESYGADKIFCDTSNNELEDKCETKIEDSTVSQDDSSNNSNSNGMISKMFQRVSGVFSRKNSSTA